MTSRFNVSGEWRGGRFPGVSLVTCTHRLQGTVTSEQSTVQAVLTCRGPRRLQRWQAVMRGFKSGMRARYVSLASWVLTLLRSCPRQRLRHPACGLQLPHCSGTPTQLSPFYLGHVSLFTWKSQSLCVRVRNWCI